MSHGPLTLGEAVKVQDHVVWSHQKVIGTSIVMDGSEPQQAHMRAWEGSEINLNADRMSPSKEVELRSDDRWYKAMRDILAHRPLD